MKVECIQNKSEDWDFQLQIGEAYHVVEIYIEKQDEADKDLVKFRLIGGELEVPAIFPSSIFNVTDGSVPAGWVFHQSDSSTSSIGPKSWSRDGFWEDYFDGEASAVKAFNDEIELLKNQ